MDERDDRRTPIGRAERRRPLDDEDEAEPHATGPSTIQLGRAGRPPGILAISIVLFVAIAIIKPWPQTVRPPAPVETRRAVAAQPTPQPTADPLSELRSHCEQPLGWRVYSIERWADQTLRIWRSLQPASAAVDATDPGIPAIPLGPAVDLVGYCSPWDGAERPPAESHLSAWSVDPAAGPAHATPMDLELIAPRPPSVLGALFGSRSATRPSAGPTPTPGGSAAGSAPGSVAAGQSGEPSQSNDPVGGPGASSGTLAVTAIWPSGHFVFELVAPGWQRWWAVDIPAAVNAQPS
jgi:hypothetical protein